MITNNKVFIAIQYIFLFCLVIMAVIPFWLLISSSFTTEKEILESGYSLFPKIVTFDAYRYLFSVSGGVLRAYMMSIIIAGSGVFTCLVLTILFAYPLSKQELPGKNFFAFFLFFTMLFNGGLVPTYMVYTQLFHIKDTLFGMIIPGLLMSPFNVIMVRTYITSNVQAHFGHSGADDGPGLLEQLDQRYLLHPEPY